MNTMFGYYRGQGINRKPDRLTADAIVEKIHGSWTVTKNRYGQHGIELSQRQVDTLFIMDLASQQHFFEMVGV